MKLLAIGVSKEFKTWSIPLEQEEKIEPSEVAHALYNDEKSDHTLPISIAIVNVAEGLPVVQEAYRFVDDDWEGLDVEPGVYPRPGAKEEAK